MKNIISLFTILFFSSQLFAETIKLKITYNGNAVVGHNITVASAGGIRTGTTDSNGELSVSVGSLAHKSIDLNGKKTCDNSEKKWELKGYVTLDDNNFAHVKMEVPLDEMAGEMGLNGNMLAAGWGLLCNDSASNSTSSPSSSNTGVTTNASTTQETKTGNTADPKTRAELLADEKDGLNSSIALQENKIAKKKNSLTEDSDNLSDQEKAMIKLEIEELEIKQELNKIELETVDRELANGSLSKADRTEFMTRKDKAKNTLEANKEKQKTLKMEMKSGGNQGQIKRAEPDATEQTLEENAEVEPTMGAPVPPATPESTPLTDKEISRLKMERSSLKVKLKSLEAELNMKENSLQNKTEKGELDESEISIRRQSIELTKQKIADKELKIKQITEQVGE